MDKVVLDYGSGRPRSRWKQLVLRTIAGAVAAVVLMTSVLLFRLYLEESRFCALITPANVCGKTVFQIVTLLGKPQEDHLNENASASGVGWIAPPRYTPTNHVHSNGHIGYGDPYCGEWYNIEFLNGVATQVTHSPDMK